MPYNNFPQMVYYYLRRNIFNQHDMQLLNKGIVTNDTSFLKYIVEPKMFLGRLNYGDYLRICAVIFG